MTHRYTISGLAFLVDDGLPDLESHGFADAELRARFVADAEFRALESSAVRRIEGPMGLIGAIDPSAKACWLPQSDAPPADRAWQLRQMAPVFSAVLERLVLHAGAVELQNRVVAFVGPSGTGKSTLTRYLADRGFPFVADDLLPVRFLPSPRVPVGDRLLPLAAVYFLNRTDDDTATVTQLSRVDALRSLIRHGFGEHRDRSSWQFQFDAYHRIAEAVPLFDLVIPNDVAALPLVEGVIAASRTGRSTSEIDKPGSSA